MFAHESFLWRPCNRYIKTGNLRCNFIRSRKRVISFQSRRKVSWILCHDNSSSLASRSGSYQDYHTLSRISKRKMAEREDSIESLFYIQQDENHVHPDVGMCYGVY